MNRFLLSVALLAASAAGLVPAVSAADMSYLGQSEYGYAGYSPGGSLYINALPSNAEVRLDGVLVGVANDLQATPVEARPGCTGSPSRHRGTSPLRCWCGWCGTGLRGCG